MTTIIETHLQISEGVGIQILSILALQQLSTYKSIWGFWEIDLFKEDCYS